MTGQQTANQDITTNYWESLHIAWNIKKNVDFGGMLNCKSLMQILIEAYTYHKYSVYMY